MNDNEAKAYRATEPKGLTESLMSPNVPKSEREHHAVRIIEAADALAKAAKSYADVQLHGTYTALRDALAAYEKVRGMK